MNRSWNLNGIVVTEDRNEDRSTWTISKAQNETQASDTALLVYEAGSIASKVWALDDDTFFKSKSLIPDTTLEHETLAFVQSQPRDFKVPLVHHHKVIDDRYYIILSRVSGSTLAEAWPKMDHANKGRCVSRMADICQQMNNWGTGSTTISGIDGNYLSEQFLSAKSGNITGDELSPSKLKTNCQAIGLDCSTLVFYHCDLGPGNIIVDEGDITGVIDWECAGWVPIAWVRTKFRICSGLDLNSSDNDERIEWRKLVQLELEGREFPDAMEKWFQWRKGSAHSG